MGHFLFSKNDQASRTSHQSCCLPIFSLVLVSIFSAPHLLSEIDYLIRHFTSSIHTPIPKTLFGIVSHQTTRIATQGEIECVLLITGLGITIRGRIGCLSPMQRRTPLSDSRRRFSLPPLQGRSSYDHQNLSAS